MFNLDLARLTHRHGSEWYEMTPVSAHSPDPRDPERRLLAGERVFRCTGCDEEIRILPPDVPG